MPVVLVPVVLGALSVRVFTFRQKLKKAVKGMLKVHDGYIIILAMICNIFEIGRIFYRKNFGF